MKHIPFFAAVLALALDASIHFVCAQESKPVDTPAAAEKSETLEKKSDAETRDKPAEEKEEAKPRSDQPMKKEGLTDQLLQDLGLQPDGEQANPLDAIIERMRDVQQRLQKTETDTETRDIQTRIVKDLDELIEKLKNQKPPPPKPNQNQNQPPPMGNPSDSQPRAGGQPKPQNSQKQRGTGGSDQDKQQAGANKSPAEKSRQSSNDPKPGQPRTAEEEAARQRLAKDVWGHLPPALRQELLNVYSEKFLPKYDTLVRKYYEALAEQNRK